jgi:hypothetical protein
VVSKIWLRTFPITTSPVSSLPVRQPGDNGKPTAAFACSVAKPPATQEADAAAGAMADDLRLERHAESASGGPNPIIERAVLRFLADVKLVSIQAKR